MDQADRDTPVKPVTIREVLGQVCLGEERTIASIGTGLFIVKAATPARQGATKRSKLRPQSSGTVPVRRQALLEFLVTVRRRRLVLVTGGAGFGKTTLLTQWRDECAAEGVTNPWVSLGSDEAEMQGFLQALSAALGAAGVDVGDGWHSENEVVLSELLEALEVHPSEVNLFVDDYHCVTDPGVHALMQGLVEHAPPHCHVLLGSRVTPPLTLSRLRVMEQVAEVDAQLLSFGPSELREFLRLSECEVDADQLALIQEVTRGWPSCVQLLTLMWRDVPVMHRSTEVLTRRREDVHRYLTEEVVNALDGEVAACLERLAILPRFNAALAQHMTACPDGQELVNWLEQHNLFTMRMQSSFGWFRFHPLFAEFLCVRLSQRGADSVQAAHRHAASWFAEQGMLADAVRHACLADAPELAGDFIEQAKVGTWSLSQLAPTLRLLEMLPEHILLSRPRLAFMASLAVALTANTERASRWLSERGDEGPEWNLVHALVALQRDDMPGVIRWLESTASTPLSNHALRMLQVSTLASAYAGEGRYAEARHLILQANVRADQQCGDVALVVAGAGVLTLLREGRVREARAESGRLLPLAQFHHGRRAVCTNLHAVYFADASYEMDCIDDARESLANRLGLLHASGPEVALLASTCRANLDLLQEGPEVALQFLKQQIHHLNSLGYERGAAHLIGEQVKIHMQLDQVALAQESADAMSRMGGEPRSRRNGFDTDLRIAQAIAQARVSMPVRTEAALDSLELAHGLALELGRNRAAMKVAVLSACALHRLGQVEAAAARMHAAQERAQDLGLKRTMLDEMPLLLQLLQHMAQHAEIPAMGHGARELLRQAGVADPEAARVRLTPRETEILSLVAQAMSNKRIAMTLQLTAETVKWNLKNIFFKLGVSSRYAAIEKAKDIELI